MLRSEHNLEKKKKKKKKGCCDNVYMIIMASSSTLQNIPLHTLRPAEHLLAHLVNEVRPDGRQLRQPRPIAVLPVPWQKQSNVLASKHVQLGGSVALGVVKLSIGTPAIQRPNVGDIGNISSPF